MEQRPRPSVAFMLSDGTTADFEEFWRQDPIGAAQYASGLARAKNEHFEGFEELQKVLNTPDLSVDRMKEQLRSFASKSPKVFNYVQKTEANLQKEREGSIGWSTS